ncbi:MAG: FAD-dependent oxidoreductase [Actinobacteria bacterium]|nr:FAD-dependent oxidoreductase [Actinomycetota bacterium]
MRAGVFLCECGGNISGVVEMESLAAYARTLDGVVEVAIDQFMCGTEGRAMIEQAVEERGLDRLVIASCSQRFQGPTFDRIARELKLGENAVAFANIREGCSFVHRHEPERAQEKARKIVAGAVARARHQSDLPRRRTFLSRSALVVGGGIAGMSAAEELAGAGIDVHLVEREQSLGGYMAKLARTFPTEDCAMCSLAPRLTSTALNGQIHIHTLTDVEEISGPPGELHVTLRHHPRYVTEACVGCGECVPVCPVHYPSSYEEGIAERTAIYRPFANAVPSTFAVEKKGWSPCKSACAVHTSAQGYVALVAAGRFEEAYRVASEPNPFPSVCGRVCTALCETACARGSVDEPIAIAGLKRFVADTVGPTLPVQPTPLVHPEPVAIVGAGPAGLTCARDLANLGYKVTLFEAQPVAGGMLRTGIPDYRLPHDVIEREIEQVLALGPELRLGQRAGADFTIDGLFEQGYKAVYLATGLQKSADVALPGDGLAGVVRAVEMLRELNLGGTPKLGEKVVVIGGGDVALDAARSAIRLQTAAGHTPDVTLVYRRTEVEMPANASELEEAREEGLKVELLVQPLEVLGGGGEGPGGDAGRLRVAGLRVQRCELGEPDASGRRQPVPIAGSELELAADTVVFAVGQALVDDFARGCEGLELKDGQIPIDRDTMMTTRAGVFAGGDAAAVGFSTVIEAVAAGRRGAAAIHNYLRGERLLPVWDDGRPEARPADDELAALEPGRRVPMQVIDGLQRRTGWAEVSPGYSAEEAVAEAQRCLDCAVCSECDSCVRACPSGAIDWDQTETVEEISVGAVILATGHRQFDAARKKPLGYGRHANVLTQGQLSRLLSAAGPTEGELYRPSDGAVPKRIFMLQCVGSRDVTSTGNQHCSAVCCLFATLNASLIKQHYPDTEVTIGYTDLRAPGKAHEEYYRLVQERGVRYMRGRVGEIIEEKDGSLRIRLEDTMTGRKQEDVYDLVVLSAGLEAGDGTLDIAHVAGVQTGAGGFIREYHPKLAPVDTQRAGMFVAGTAQGPKSIPDSIAQAKAAAARVIAMLSSGYTLTAAQVAAGDPETCIACGVCVEACPQGAIHLTTGTDAHSVVDPNICRGCGICAAECPTGAMQLGRYSDAEVLAEATA